MLVPEPVKVLDIELSEPLKVLDMLVSEPLKVLDIELSLPQQPLLMLLSELLKLLDMPLSVLDMLDMPPSLDDMPLDMPPSLDDMPPPSPPSWAPAGEAERPITRAPPSSSAATSMPCLGARARHGDGGSESPSSTSGGESSPTVTTVVWSAHPAASSDAVLVIGQPVAGRIGGRAAAGVLGAAAVRGFGSRLRQTRMRSLDLIVRTSFIRALLFGRGGERSAPLPPSPPTTRRGTGPG
jgi:hypothetical protein